MKTQISLHIYAVWSESSLFAWWNSASLTIQNAPSEDSDQTVSAQANLNLRWAHTSKGTFSDVTVHVDVAKRKGFEHVWAANPDRPPANLWFDREFVFSG